MRLLSIARPLDRIPHRTRATDLIECLERGQEGIDLMERDIKASPQRLHRTVSVLSGPEDSRHVEFFFKPLRCADKPLSLADDLRTELMNSPECGPTIEERCLERRGGRFG